MAAMNRQVQLLMAIDDALKNGRPTPTNNRICEMMGFAELNRAARMVSDMIRAGRIEATWPSPSRRVLSITPLGQRVLAGETVPSSPKRWKERDLRHPDVSEMPPITDGRESVVRSAAENGNARFLAAFAKLAPVPDAVDRDGRRFAMLPPPSLSAAAAIS